MPVNSAELQLFDLLEKRMAANTPKPLEQQTIAEFRAGGAVFSEFTGEPADVMFEDSTIPARDGYKIPIRVFNKHLDRGPVLIFYPGCGYMLDLFESNAVACSRIAKFTGMKVILVQFRLVPEYSLITAINDGYDAARFIVMHPEQFSIDPNHIFIGGISSGAHCAANVTQMARNDQEIHFVRQILVSGWFDWSRSNHEYDAFEKEDKLCTKDAIAYLLKHYGLNSEQLKQAPFSPYYQNNLSNLPPTTLIVGEYDGVRNDTEAYYEKLKAVGNQVEKIVLAGETHNTMLIRKAMSDGEDPAEVVANVIRKQLGVKLSCATI